MQNEMRQCAWVVVTHNGWTACDILSLMHMSPATELLLRSETKSY